jgi:quercetin dioxygenase-like cupin family protein
MADVTVMRMGEFDSVSPPEDSPMGGMTFHRVRGGLGVESIGLGVVELPPDFSGYPDHDHADGGQEEVFTPLEGSVTFQAGGLGGEPHELEPGVFVRVGPGTRRTFVTAGGPAKLLALGGTPGEAYSSPENPMDGLTMHPPGTDPQTDDLDVTVIAADDCEAIFLGGLKKVRAELGVTSFGLQVVDLPPGNDRYPEHDHSESGQEEIYIGLSGSAVLLVGGDDGERFPIERGTFVRIGPDERRKLVTEDSGARLIALGATPGKAYEVWERTELGAPDPFAQQS